MHLTASYGVTGIGVVFGDEKPNLRITSMREPRNRVVERKLVHLRDIALEGNFVYLLQGL